VSLAAFAVSLAAFAVSLAAFAVPLAAFAVPLAAGGSLGDVDATGLGGPAGRLAAFRRLGRAVGWSDDEVVLSVVLSLLSSST
jgi:hypothetical protein